MGTYIVGLAYLVVKVFLACLVGRIAAKLDSVTTAKRVDMIEKTGVPAYLQIAGNLREQIQQGLLTPEEPLPSTAELGRQYGVSASVVKAAISVLRTEGLVVGQQGKGVFVRPAGQDQQPEDVDDDALAAQLGEIQSAIQDLSGRMAAIEAAVFPKSSRTDRSGK